METRTFPEQIDCYCWCPTMDLLAVSTGQRVLVYRMNGIKVWDIVVKSVKQIVWRPDGKLFALITHLHTLVYDTNTSRLLTTLKTSSNFGHWILGDASSIEEDVIKCLPKLPPLPSNAEGYTFTSRQAIDGVQKHMDLLFAIGDQSVCITLYGMFSIDIVIDDEIVNSVTRSLQDHYLLTKNMTLRRFHIELNGLQETTFICSKVITLLKYVEEILSFATTTIKSYMEFNTKYIGILKSELADSTVIDELYNLLLTGMMSDQLKDWLQNTVGDRGITKWLKFGELAFDHTRRTILYHLIPSMERLIIHLSQLNTLSSTSIKSVKQMLKLLYQDIFKINREQELFQSFIIWIQSILSELQDEKPKRGYITSEVGIFINNHMERSTLTMLIPLLRRSYNQIKIDTNDMFEFIKTKIKSEIDMNFELEIDVSSRQEMKFVNDDLYVVTCHMNLVKIYKIDINIGNMNKVIITFDQEIQDIQLSDDLYVVTNRIIKFDYQKNEFANDFISQDQLHTTEYELPINIKYLSINDTRGVACAIDKDLLKYCVYEL